MNRERWNAVVKSLVRVLLSGALLRSKDLKVRLARNVEWWRL